MTAPLARLPPSSERYRVAGRDRKTAAEAAGFPGCGHALEGASDPDQGDQRLCQACWRAVTAHLANVICPGAAQADVPARPPVDTMSYAASEVWCALARAVPAPPTDTTAWAKYLTEYAAWETLVTAWDWSEAQAQWLRQQVAHDMVALRQLPAKEIERRLGQLDTDIRGGRLR